MKNGSDSIIIPNINSYEGRFPFSAGRQLLCVKEKGLLRVVDIGDTTVGLADIYDANYLRVYKSVGKYSVVQVLRSTPGEVECFVRDADYQIQPVIDEILRKRPGEYPYDEEYPYEYNLTDPDEDEWRTMPVEFRNCFPDPYYDEEDYNTNFYKELSDDFNERFREEFMNYPSEKSPESWEAAWLYDFEFSTDEFMLIARVIIMKFEVEMGVLSDTVKRELPNNYQWVIINGDYDDVLNPPEEMDMLKKDLIWTYKTAKEKHLI